MRFQVFITLLIFSIAIVGCESETPTVENNEIVSSETKKQEVIENTETLLVDSATVEPEPIPTPEKTEPKKEVVKKVETPKKKKTVKGSAKITFESKKYDYGMIEQGDKVNHTFKFKNTGNSNLIIKDAKASCGCTTPTYPFIPIAPGKTGEISVVFSSVGKMGPQRPSITITTNAYPRTQTLYLEGFVRDKPKAKTSEVVKETVEEKIEETPIEEEEIEDF